MTSTPTPSHWAKVKEVFECIKALPPGDRNEAICREEARDAKVGARVREMVRADEAAADLRTLTIPTLPKIASQKTALQPGDVLAQRFEVIQQLGAGGGGEVYRVFDRSRDREVALKIVHFRGIDRASELAALRNELNTACSVAHPNVCRVFDITLPAEDEQGPAFITMELLEGETLSQRIRNKPLLHNEAVEIVKGIVSGLQAAHDKNILHRDLKPSNVMLVQEGDQLRPVILDFGLARDTTMHGSVLTDTRIAGTPEFMAPEIFEGAQATVASDLNSLGVLLFNMVTGRLPFEGDRFIEIELRKRTSIAPLARQFSPHVDPSWEFTIAKCLERDPNKRPRSAAEVLKLLQKSPPHVWIYRGFLPAVAAAVVLTIGFQAFRPPAIDPVAAQEFDKAKVAVENRSKGGFDSALRSLGIATQRAPRWSAAWAELAYVYATASNWRFMEGRIAEPKAEEAAGRALALDARLARAHAALGCVWSFDFDKWPKAEQEFRNALKLDPQDGVTRYWYAIHLRKQRRFEEAEKQIDEALALTHRENPNIWIERAFLLWTEGKLDEMERHLADQLIAFPNVAFTRFLNARLLKEQHRFDDAERELDFALRLGANANTILAEKASLNAVRGDADQARKELATLIERQKTETIDGLMVAGVCAALGDKELAFDQLNKAYAARDNTLLSAATSPVLQPLRSDPRFRELLGKIHFGPQIMQQMGFKSPSPNAFGSQPKATGTL